MLYPRNILRQTILKEFQQESAYFNVTKYMDKMQARFLVKVDGIPKGCKVKIVFAKSMTPSSLGLTNSSFISDLYEPRTKVRLHFRQTEFHNYDSILFRKLYSSNKALGGRFLYERN
jgi:hypothetical protein